MKETNVGFLVFPGLMQLDLTGAYGVLAAGPGVATHLIWKDLQPVVSSDGLIITPTVTMQNCPDLQVLCVPGGAGILPLLEDMDTLNFLNEKAKSVHYVTSVCTGALVLGAAGLLQGYKATTHWAYTDLLAPFGASYTAQRVVVDRNRITAAGVTSGIDMAFSLSVELWGQKIAKTIALNMEYAPEPPFLAGSPDLAPPEIVQDLRTANAERLETRKEAVLRAASRLRNQKQ